MSPRDQIIRVIELVGRAGTSYALNSEEQESYIINPEEIADAIMAVMRDDSPDPGPWPAPDVRDRLLWSQDGPSHFPEEYPFSVWWTRTPGDREPLTSTAVRHLSFPIARQTAEASARARAKRTAARVRSKRLWTCPHCDTSWTSAAVPSRCPLCKEGL